MYPPQLTVPPMCTAKAASLFPNAQRPPPAPLHGRGGNAAKAALRSALLARSLARNAHLGGFPCCRSRSGCSRRTAQP